jgi:hypothetical protein
MIRNSDASIVQTAVKPLFGLEQDQADVSQVDWSKTEDGMLDVGQRADSRLLLDRPVAEIHTHVDDPALWAARPERVMRCCLGYHNTLNRIGKIQIRNNNPDVNEQNHLPIGICSKHHAFTLAWCGDA